MTDLDEVVAHQDYELPSGDKKNKISRGSEANTEITEVEELTINKNENNKQGQTEKVERKKNNHKFSSKKWTCDDGKLWRSYMMSFIDKQRKLKLKRENKFEKRLPVNLSQLSEPISRQDLPSQLEYYPFNSFNQHFMKNLTNQSNKQDSEIRIWRKMCINRPVNIINDFSQVPSKVSRNDVALEWSCIKEKIGEHKIFLEKMKGRKKDEVLPCYLKRDGTSIDESKDNFADHKELGHARIPPICLETTKHLLVDRAAGENVGLVKGDFLMFELISRKKGKRVFADVCLRGLKGMHIVELSPKRARKKTWKFCFYQAVIALLVKTQLRYKYVSSANIDYIYDHAWMLFVHLGCINTRKSQRLDDVVVYNYKYSIELELIDELKDIFRATDVTWDFLEKTVKKWQEMKRKELMNTTEAIGLIKVPTMQKLAVHRETKKIEEWFDKLDIQHKNCIIKTSRFCLAFWKDDFFWYLYNPFRCNEFGFWDDFGYCCMMKFCSRDSLKRHLMILLLRAYIYEAHFELSKDEKSESEEENKGDLGEDKDSVRVNLKNLEKNEESAKGENLRQKEPILEKDVFTVQIFQMIYHCCQVHNINLLQRSAITSKIQVTHKKELDECIEGNSVESRGKFNVFNREKIEKSSWLETMTISWTRYSNSKMKRKIESDAHTKKLMWHQYYVEEEGKLFSLWSQLHIRDDVFPEKNRGKQAHACIVVCAGMTRLMAPEYWTQRTLDVILFCGDGYYTSSILEAEAKSQKPELLNFECCSNNLYEYFKIGEFLFHAQVLPAIFGKLYISSNECLWKVLETFFSKYRFGILTCENACLGVLKFRGAYYMFDAHSKGPPVFQFGTGTAYLLRSSYFHKFITCLILTIGSSECSQFALNPIEILKIFDLDDIICPAKKKRENV